MNECYRLNRLKITGKLNEFTPKSVVCEILKAHSICLYKEINSLAELLNEIRQIDKYRTDDIYKPFSEKDLRRLATFINHECKTWTQSSLINSYDHMINFDVKNINGIVFGQKTYCTPYNYNSCMLYSVCKFYKIETRWNMSNEEMLNSINNLKLSYSNLQDQLSSYVQRINSKSDLINILNQLNLNSKNNIVELIEDQVDKNDTADLSPILDLSISDLNASLNKMKNTSFLLRQINPKNHIDSIILAAILYNINITESTVPYQEYNKIRECKNLQFYTPVDATFRKRLNINPQWYDLSIHWEPLLSAIYDTEGLKKLCIHEGFTAQDFRGYGFEALLQISRISHNVFYGKNIYSRQEYTPIMMEEIKDLSNDDCVTLGILETKDLLTFSMNELAMLFENEKAFKNPTKTSEILDSRIINKIKLYATNCQHTKLLNVIEEVEKWKEYSNEFTNNLRSCYNKNPLVVKIFNKIIDIGMYMRGWKVTSQSYPMNEKETMLKENQLLEVENNITVSIQNLFDDLENQSIDIKKLFETLPLFKYSINEKTGEKSYIVTPDPDDGKSILERLMFVLKGDKHKNMKSCIRLSSNIILTSSYFYIRSLGLPEPFNINNLDYIS
jgi:hypothetical protein